MEELSEVAEVPKEQAVRIASDPYRKIPKRYKLSSVRGALTRRPSVDKPELDFFAEVPEFKAGSRYAQRYNRYLNSDFTRLEAVALAKSGLNLTSKQIENLVKTRQKRVEQREKQAIRSYERNFTHLPRPRRDDFRRIAIQSVVQNVNPNELIEPVRDRARIFGITRDLSPQDQQRVRIMQEAGLTTEEIKYATKHKFIILREDVVTRKDRGLFNQVIRALGARKLFIDYYMRNFRVSRAQAVRAANLELRKKLHAASFRGEDLDNWLYEGSPV